MNFLKKLFKSSKKKEKNEPAEPSKELTIQNFKYLYNNMPYTPHIVIDYDQLKNILDMRYRISEAWDLVYSNYQHGSSLKTFHMFTKGQKPPFLIVIQDVEYGVFGVFFDGSMEMRKEVFGRNSSFLFKMKKVTVANKHKGADVGQNSTVKGSKTNADKAEGESKHDKKIDFYFQAYKATYKNKYYCNSTPEYLAFGVSNGKFGLSLNSTFLSADTALVAGAKKTEFTIDLKSAEKLLIAEKFSDMSLNDKLRQGIYEMGYEKPSIIQAHAIPIILAHKHLAIQSKSGTGKTISFAAGVLQLVTSTKKPQAIIMTPTKELNAQIGNILSVLGKHINICTYVTSGSHNSDVTKLVEGVDRNELECEIIVGSPGSLLKLLREKRFDPTLIKIFVADEADACLGDHGALTMRLLKMLDNAQKIFVSATYSEVVKNMIAHYAPGHAMIYTENSKPDEIKLFYIEVDHREKINVLFELIEYLSIGQMIVFVKTKKMADKLKMVLEEDMHKVGCVHGDMDDAAREEAVAEFRKAVTKVLVCTDVFSRGMDIPQVNLVVNFDMPVFRGNVLMENYIHRIGRSGRFGRIGFIVDFIADKEDFEALVGIQGELKSVSKKFSIAALKQVFFDKSA